MFVFTSDSGMIVLPAHRLVSGGVGQMASLHEWSEAAAALTDGKCELADLIPAVTIHDVEAIAVSGETIPQPRHLFEGSLDGRRLSHVRAGAL